jgi:hypothetical protein
MNLFKFKRVKYLYFMPNNIKLMAYESFLKMCISLQNAI